MADEVLSGSVVPPGPEILKLSTDQAVEPRKTVPLFSIDGFNFELWINPPPTVGLRYLKICRDRSVEAGTAYLLETMIGADGYEALMNFEALTEEQYNWVVTQAVKRSTGPTERPKGRTGSYVPNS